MTNSFTTLILETDGPLAIITLNRPDKLNAFNTDLRLELFEAVKQIEADKNILAAIIKGSGRGFCAGADLGEGADPEKITNQLNNEYKPFLEAIANGNKIYIAQVHGSAAGIGAALAMNCDLVVMEEKATIYMAFAAIGLIPDGGNTQLLLNAMGYRHALQTILEGKHLKAETCLSYGIANKIVGAEDLESETLAWAKSLCLGAPLAIAAAKRLLRRVDSHSFADCISVEADEQKALLESDDFKNAVASFFKKEKPVFHGK